MAGLHRRKFVDIIADKFTDHYQGKVSSEDMEMALKKVSELVAKLEESRVNGMERRMENLRKLKRMSPNKLEQLLNE